MWLTGQGGPSCNTLLALPSQVSPQALAGQTQESPPPQGPVLSALPSPGSALSSGILPFLCHNPVEEAEAFLVPTDLFISTMDLPLYSAMPV